MNNLQWLTQLKSKECPDATYAPESTPLVFVEGQGSLIYDSEGREYIDLSSGFGVMAYGHNPQFAKDVFNQEKLLMHGMGDVYPSRYKVELLSKVISRLPEHLTHGALAVTGSQAVEYAMKTAMLHTGRSGFIALSGGYHGLDFGALSVTERPDFRAPFRSWLSEDQVAFVQPESRPEVVKAAVASLIRKGYSPAAFIAEPIQGRAGIKPLSPQFLSSLREISREVGALLIFDEIFCGYGRSGCFSYGDQFDCDLTCLGKPMGGGLPLSGFFAREEVMRAWPESKGEAIHTGTFFGHALACQLGLRLLDELTTQNMETYAPDWEMAVREGISQRPELKRFMVSGRGMMLALNSSQPGLGCRLMDECRNRGLIVLASGPKAEGISLTPAYNIPKSLMDRALQILAEAASAV